MFCRVSPPEKFRARKSRALEQLASRRSSGAAETRPVRHFRPKPEEIRHPESTWGALSRRKPMVLMKSRKLLAGVAAASVITALGFAYAQQAPRGKTSYMPVAITEPFSAIFARLSAQKAEVTRAHMALLNARYDLSNRPAAGVTMDRTKPAQEGVRVKLPAG